MYLLQYTFYHYFRVYSNYEIMSAVNQCAMLYLIHLVFLVSLNYIIFSCAGFHPCCFIN